jgi:hypothetical protein
MSNVSVEADGVEVGQLVAKGTATTRTVIDINEAGFKTEMDRVIRALTNAPGPDMVLGTADDEIIYTRTDGKTKIASDRFKVEFAGFLPTDRLPGPDGIPGNADDTFTGGDLAMRIDTEFGRLRDAVTADYSAVNGTTNGYTIGTDSPDVTLTWKDNVKPGVAGNADFDVNELFLRALIPNTVISEAAKEWALAEALNQTVMNNGPVCRLQRDHMGQRHHLGRQARQHVGHEIAHTFGLNDAYLSDPGGPIDTNPIPDLMNAAGFDDPDKMFSGEQHQAAPGRARLSAKRRPAAEGGVTDVSR